MGRAPDGRGSPLSGRGSCACPGGRRIGAAEAKDRQTTSPPSPAQTGIMTVPKEMPEKWARAGAPPSWSSKKPSWGTGNGRQRRAALPGRRFPLTLTAGCAQPSLVLAFPDPAMLAPEGLALASPCTVFGDDAGRGVGAERGLRTGKFLGVRCPRREGAL